MARPATGTIVEDTRGATVRYAARFRAYGERRYVPLGTREQGWTRAKAERELELILADVERGTWQPARPAPKPTAPTVIPTFQEFASEWFERQTLEGGRHGDGLTPAGVADLEWRIAFHLLPFFAAMRLGAITVADVDRFRLAKVRERDTVTRAAQDGKPLMETYTDKQGRTLTRRRTAIGAGSVNKTIGTLAAILETAVEYELIPRNVARGRRRRLTTTTPARAWIDRAEQVTALLDAAGTLDRDAGRGRVGQRRPLLAILVFAGLRIGEALELRWQDIDLARGTIVVRQAKTDAGVRTVNVLAVLGDELRAYAAAVKGDPQELVFATSNGRTIGASNVRRRVLAPAIAAANEQLAAAGRDLIPVTVTPHALRRTYASILFATGEAPPYVSGQMGHTRPSFTLALYARAMDRRDGEPERLQALVRGLEWAANGQQDPNFASNPSGAGGSGNKKGPH